MSFSYLELSFHACPICGGESFSNLNGNDRYFMKLYTVGCDNCGLIQTNPRPSRDGLDLFYERDYRKFYQGVTQSGQEYIRQYNKNERLKYTVSFFKSLINFKLDSSILDFGCSEGTLFSALRADGFSGNLYGVELNKDFAQYAEINNNAKVFSSLEMLDIPCDLVVVNHVFEHLLEPKRFLVDISRLIKDDGLLYIDVPDADEYNSLGDLHIAHLFHYTPRTLPYLIELCGFEIVSCIKHTPPFHPKSIRLLAKKTKTILSNFSASNPSNEASAWLRVKKISSFQPRIKGIVLRLPFVRSTYKLLRRFI